MSFDMEKDPFANTTFGRLALKKLAPVSPDFRLYSAGWLGAKPEDWKVMSVTGAEFRVAKSGPNKGLRVIRVPGTSQTVHVTAKAMRAWEAKHGRPAKPTAPSA